MNIEVSTRLSSKTALVGSEHKAGSGSLRIHEAARYMSQGTILEAFVLADRVLDALPDRMGNTPWWRIVQFRDDRMTPKPPKNLDVLDLAGWLVACAIPRGSVLTAWKRISTWLVEQGVECNEQHVHSRRLLDEGHVVCVAKTTTMAEVKRLNAALKQEVTNA
jgi:hypothetical protein